MALGLNAAAAAAQRFGGIKFNPFNGYNFFVEIEGLLVGGFSAVEGLEFSAEVKTVREGGVNDKEYKLFGQITYSDIVLRQGVTAIDPIWYWYNSTLEGKIKRKNGSIYMLDERGIPNVWYNFYNAWPSKWQGPSLDASQNIVATQSITLVHEGINKSIMAEAYSAAKGIV
jgi:conserved hypothetical phage tail region protein